MMPSRTATISPPGQKKGSSLLLTHLPIFYNRYLWQDLFAYSIQTLGTMSYGENHQQAILGITFYTPIDAGWLGFGRCPWRSYGVDYRRFQR
ncbi:hypothetical protein DESC_590168 [Desulfosarcina cetonica]|nr:hypothetical protein DESC_590168 [Desulfosarcina cetonica]